MKISKELMKHAGIMPKLKLAIRVGKGVQGTGPHTVRMIEDKIVKGRDYENNTTIEKVRYIVEEDGEKKQYETRLKSKDTGDLQYLVQHLADVPEGEEVTLEFKRAGVRGYIEVTYKGQTVKAEASEEDEGPSEEEIGEALEKVEIQ